MKNKRSRTELVQNNAVLLRSLKILELIFTYLTPLNLHHGWLVGPWFQSRGRHFVWRNDRKYYQKCGLKI